MDHFYSVFGLLWNMHLVPMISEEIISVYMYLLINVCFSAGLCAFTIFWFRSYLVEK